MLKVDVKSSDDEGVQLVNAAKIVRQDILSRDYDFNGSFKSNDDMCLIPPGLSSLVRMILQGTNIQKESHTSDAMKKVISSISEIVMFNTKTKSRETEGESKIRHQKNRETPLPIYTSLLLHAKTRQKDLINKLSEYGICISYSRTMAISTQLANSVCKRFDEEECVCPPKLKKNVFSIGAFDNIDHNPSARTAKDSFHGTAISIMQAPTEENEGVDRQSEIITEEVIEEKKMLQLPEIYTEVPPTILKTTEPTVPKVWGPKKPELNADANTFQEERDWLIHVEVSLKKEELEKTDFVSWAAYHASKQLTPPRPIGTIALLPLFEEPAHSVPMVSHCLDLIKTNIDFLNNGQTAVATADLPLYALAKQIQWSFSDTYGETVFVLLLGGLHIEMNVLKLLGDFLRGSGWTAVLVQAEVTTTGRADAILLGKHITRSRHAHQVTAAALHILLSSAYNDYEARTENPLDFDNWFTLQCNECPQFYYWSLVLELELLMLQFVRSIREGNFELYVQSLASLVPWMFALDHTNYSRWLPVHIRDMVTLKTQNPSIYEEFAKGHFAVQKTAHVFSLLSPDHAHEQLNDVAKGVGGIIGLTDNPSALLRWIISGPEVARLLEEYEATGKTPKDQRTDHHDQLPGVQKEFAVHVNSTISCFEEFGNPFCEDSQDLIALDTKRVMEKETVESIRNVKDIGQKQYEKFVEERLEKCTTPITNTISKNNLPLPGSTNKVKHSRSDYQIASLKSNCDLFGRMYIASQSRNGDMDEFFRHENQRCPPALSDMGLIRSCTKSDLLSCLDEYGPSTDECPIVDAKIIDGSAIVHMLPPKECRTFHDYSEKRFLPYIVREAQSVQRLDVVWDTYNQNSLKASTRQMRGTGIRLVFKDSTTIPSNWQSFLRVDENKVELFNFLSNEIAILVLHGKEIITTSGTDVLSSSELQESQYIMPCDHEEADSRLLLHAFHCSKTGSKTVLIRTVDTDVVALAVAAFQELNLDHIWIAFGTGRHFRYIPAHSIATGIGDSKAKALPVFHAYTGCDTISSFGGRGKKTAWDTWKAFPPVTEAFLALYDSPDSVTDNAMEELERFVVLLYHRVSGCRKVNVARKELFAKGRQVEQIPPTQDALLQHTKRAAFQGGYCWGRIMIAIQDLPSPGDWGWVQNPQGKWIPWWITIPEAAKCCTELIKCGCKKACKPPCKCSKASLPCTDLCACSGSCYQDS